MSKSTMMKAPAHHVDVKAMRMPHGLGLPLPSYQTDDAAGMDLLAAVPLTTPMRLLPGMRQLVPTGLTIEIPSGYEGQVRPRSGLALNHGVTVLNAPGTVDADYRGEIKVLLVNLGRETFVITRGQRIAQLVIQPVARAVMVDVRALAASRRGEAGFGSTGLAAAAISTPRPAMTSVGPPLSKVAPARPLEPQNGGLRSAPVSAPAPRPAAPLSAATRAAAPKQAPPKVSVAKAAPSKAPSRKAAPAKTAAKGDGKSLSAKKVVAKPTKKPTPAKRPAPGRSKVSARA